MKKWTDSNACIACAKSKRRCGRELPTCQRCAAKRKPCIYPAIRSTIEAPARRMHSSALIWDNPLEALHASVSSPANTSLANDDALDLDILSSANDIGSPLALVPRFSTPTTNIDWFIAPDTWKITRDFEDSITAPPGPVTRKEYIARLQAWCTRWVTHGSTLFIHAQLYSAKFPTCVQIAYATLASYVHRTPSNVRMVLQIVEDRSNELLQENGAVLEGESMDKWTDGEAQDIDVFSQLARLHALVVYQVIGLFDGDVRCRYVAEGHIAVLNSWASKLFYSAGKAFSDFHTTATTDLTDCLPRATSSAQQRWYLWVLSETIRRTWLVAASLGPIYRSLQQRWSCCPGSIMFTNRGGLWDAPTAIEWEDRCTTNGVAFLQRFEFAKISGLLNPMDMDEFGVAMLDMTCNDELLDSWRSSSGLMSNVL